MLVDPSISFQEIHLFSLPPDPLSNIPFAHAPTAQFHQWLLVAAGVNPEADVGVPDAADVDTLPPSSTSTQSGTPATAPVAPPSLGTPLALPAGDKLDQLLKPMVQPLKTPQRTGRPGNPPALLTLPSTTRTSQL